MKKFVTALLALCMVLAMIPPAHALEYTFDETEDPSYGKPTSFEPVVTADGGAQKNEDISKNAALIPPAFGSATSNTLNFEFIMNRAYALNRDKLKCRVCGGWLIADTPWAHRINPHLPLNQVNRVNNLVSFHKECFMAVNNPAQDISQFDVKAQKKIIGYREKLVPSHTRNK